MKLHNPIIITPRLMAGVRVGDTFISIDYDGREPDGRTRYWYAIDAPDFEYEDNDLQSGCQGGNLQDGLVSLLCFLGSAGEGADYEPDEDDLFRQNIMAWCHDNYDELTSLQCEIEETDNLIEEG